LYGALCQEVVWVSQIDVRVRVKYRHYCRKYCSCCTCNLRSIFRGCCKKIHTFGKSHSRASGSDSDSDDEYGRGIHNIELTDRTVWSSMAGKNTLKTTLKSIHKQRKRRYSKKRGLELETILDTNSYDLRQKKLKVEAEKFENEESYRATRAREMLRRMGLNHDESKLDEIMLNKLKKLKPPPLQNFPNDSIIPAPPTLPTAPKFISNPLAKLKWKDAARQVTKATVRKLKKPTTEAEALWMYKEGKRFFEEIAKGKHQSSKNNLNAVKKSTEFQEKNKMKRKKANAIRNRGRKLESDKAEETIVSKNSIVAVSSTARKPAVKSKWQTAMNKLNLMRSGTGKTNTLAKSTELKASDLGFSNSHVNPMHKKIGGKGKLANKKEIKSEDQIKIVMDPTTARRYSYNYSTGISEWLDERVPTGKRANKKRKSFRKIFDEEHGEYFQDVESGDTAWDLPPDSELVDAHQKKSVARKSFRKIFDEEHGEYFQDVESGDTAWNLPPDGELAAHHAVNISSTSRSCRENEEKKTQKKKSTKTNRAKMAKKKKKLHASYLKALNAINTSSNDNGLDENIIRKELIKTAVCDYVATGNDELSLQEGDELVFLEIVNNDPDWPKGRNLRTGEEGLYHVSYVE
jgi:hypothetical protein